jgi:hypothetical protein
MNVLLSYSSFTDALKSLRFDRAAWSALNQPRVLTEFATRLPLALDRRRRARRGDPFAYDQLFGPHLSRPVPVAPPAALGRQPVRAPVSRPDGLLRRWRLGSLRFARLLLRG